MMCSQRRPTQLPGCTPLLGSKPRPLGVSTAPSDRPRPWGLSPAPGDWTPPLGIEPRPLGSKPLPLNEVTLPMMCFQRRPTRLAVLDDPTPPMKGVIWTHPRLSTCLEYIRAVTQVRLCSSAIPATQTCTGRWEVKYEKNISSRYIKPSSQWARLVLYNVFSSLCISVHVWVHWRRNNYLSYLFFLFMYLFVIMRLRGFASCLLS